MLYPRNMPGTRAPPRHVSRSRSGLERSEVVLVSGLVIGLVVEEVEADALGPFPLAVEHPLDERTLRGVLREILGDLVPGLELSVVDRLRGASDVDLVLIDQLLEVLGVIVPGLPLVVGSSGLRGNAQDRLLVFVEALEFRLVPHDLEGLGRLVVGTHVEPISKSPEEDNKAGELDK